MPTTVGLTDAEELQLIALLNKIPTGAFSLNLFRALARIVRFAAVEVLIFRLNPKAGTFYALDDLPSPLVGCEETMISMCL